MSYAYFAAVENGNLSEVQKFIEDGYANVNSESRSGENNGKTAIYLAAEYGHQHIVDYLITQKSNVNTANNKAGWSPLYVAACKGHVEIAKKLLDHDADINQKNNNNLYPVYVAAYNGHVQMVKLLSEYGHQLNERLKKWRLGEKRLPSFESFDINKCMGTGWTPIYAAVYGNHFEVVEALALYGAKPDQRNGVLTPLKYAYEHKKFKMCALLVSHGADIKPYFNKFKAEEQLTLLVALQKRSPEKTRFLLQPDDHKLWFSIVEDPTTVGSQFENCKAIIEVMLSNYPTLATVKDSKGRAAEVVASESMKLVIQSVLLWHGRYRITKLEPEHTSATCFVFRAEDEHTIDDETKLYKKVALKLMRMENQFQREISIREKEFKHDFVVNVLLSHEPKVRNNQSDELIDIEADATGQLTKANAEKLFFLVMPLADKNLFVALKQERWAGENMEEVRHVCMQLVHCVEHLHEQGILHADLKTLNIVRIAGQWKLIDLDAACVIGKEPVGHKSSSAYVPPEAIFIDETTDNAFVRSVAAKNKGEANYDLLIAHPSFDIWSLGCIFYQICNKDVKPLFQGGRDDNLDWERKGVDNLFALAEWSTELKADKLADVPDKLARNLLSQMLLKDPLQRPSLARVLTHPFLSGKKVVRLVGEKPKYDIFLSYRVASDTHHVEKLYNLLTTPPYNLKVYLDTVCLQPGVDWEQGFCEGLVSSRAFVPLLSRDAINHPDKVWLNFSKLTADSSCDNVFLEHRFAVELQGLGLIEKILPIFIGNLDAATSKYSNYFGSGCHPQLFEITVKSVEKKLRHHMETQALGTPIVPDRTVKSVVDAITACQGAFIVGPADATFAAAAATIAKMLAVVPVTQSSRSATQETEIENLKRENSSMTRKITGALALLSSSDLSSVDPLTAHLRTVLQG